MGNMEPQEPGQQWLKGSGQTVTSWNRQELIWIAPGVRHVEIHRGRIDEVARALDNGTYRVPAQVLAASLMLEMVR